MAVISDSIFLDLGLLVLFAAVASLAAVRFRIPPVLALLTVGILIGPHALSFIPESEAIALFAEIGAVLLLFTIGAEFSLSKLKQFGAKAFSIGLFKLAIVFWLSFQTSLLLGLDSLASLYVSAILAISSTALTIKVLQQQGVANREEVPFLIGALVIEDLFAIFALAFFSATSGTTPSLLGWAASLAAALALLGVAYLVVLRALSKALDWLDAQSMKEAVLFLGFALAIGFSYLAKVVGLSTSIGAFLAGSIVASLPKGKVLEDAVSPFTLAFSSIFFLAIGLAVDVAVVSQNPGLLIALVGFGIVFRFVATGTSLYLNGFSAASSTFGAAALIATGEFSLIIASEGAKAVPSVDLVSLTSVMVFVSTIACSLAVGHYGVLEKWARRIMPKALQDSGHHVAADASVLMESFAQMPAAMQLRMKEAKWVAAAISVALVGSTVLIWRFGSQTLVLGGFYLPVFNVVLFVTAMILAPFLGVVLRDLAAILAYANSHSHRKSRPLNWLVLLALVLVILFGPFFGPLTGAGLSRIDLFLLAVAVATLWYLTHQRTARKAPAVLFKDARWQGEQGRKRPRK
ncbi:cation:proton antiporter [Candidatus Micrarchaeota archaeon]|nr:cation:proton antiporter [Candidatus Micrarchaeota archaeon]